VRIVAGVTDPAAASGAGSTTGGSAADGGGGSAAVASLGALDEARLADLRVGATLVAAEWPELGMAGLLWDGTRLVGVAPGSGPRVEAILEGRAPPLSVELVGLRERPAADALLETVTLGDDAADSVIGTAPPAPPTATMPGAGGRPAWVGLIGDVITDGSRQRLRLDGATITIERRCGEGRHLPEGRTSITGIGLTDPQRIIVGCDGARRAPALAVLTAAGAGATPAGPAAGSSVPARLDTEVGANHLSALLLIVGVVMLAGGMVIARRLRSAERDVDDVDGGMIDTPPDAGPQLSLVRLPSEQRP
jgi:hypothetical protein